MNNAMSILQPGTWNIAKKCAYWPEDSSAEQVCGAYAT